MRNCPSWIVSYMAILKAGGMATLLNGWWEAHEMEHAILMTDPKLIIADPPRARRMSEKCADRDILSVPIELPVEQALAPRSWPTRPPPAAIEPDDDATILFTSGSTNMAKGALSTHRAVTTGTYAYSIGLIMLLGILPRRASAAPSREPWSACRCSTSPAKCRSCSTASSSAGAWC